MAKRSLFFICASALSVAGAWSLYTDSSSDSQLVSKSNAGVSAPPLAQAGGLAKQPAYAQQPAYVQQPALPQPDQAQVAMETAIAKLTEAASMGPATMAEAEERMATASAVAEEGLAAAVKAFESSSQYLSVARPDNANVSLEQVLRTVQTDSQGRRQGGSVFVSPFGGAR